MVPARLTRDGLARMIDHTALRPEATVADIRRLCFEAKEHRFGAVCVNSSWVELCASELDGTDVAVCSVVGFPLGAMVTKAKAAEAREAVEAGATDIDMVANVGFILSNDEELFDAFEEEVEAVVAAARPASVKVILEIGFLSDDHIRRSVAACGRSGANFVKTATGFGPAWTIPQLRLMKECAGDQMKVKAAGGIRTYEQAMAAVEAGADRIGASAGVAILAQAPL